MRRKGVCRVARALLFNIAVVVIINYYYITRYCAITRYYYCIIIIITTTTAAVPFSSREGQKIVINPIILRPSNRKK